MSARIGYHPKSEFKKGMIPWNKGTKGVMKAWNKGAVGLTVAWNKGKHVDQLSQENNPAWRGDSVGYRTLHQWVERHAGKADHCSRDISHDSTRYNWANVSGEYKRDLSDWVQLCTRCNLTDGVKISPRFIEGRVSL